MKYEIVETELVEIEDTGLYPDKDGYGGRCPDYLVKFPDGTYFKTGEELHTAFKGRKIKESEVDNLKVVTSLSDWHPLDVDIKEHINGTMACSLGGTDILHVEDMLLRDRRMFIRLIEG
jgi:hypothetical protein